MRRMIPLILIVGVWAIPAAAETPALNFDEIVRRTLPDTSSLRDQIELARLDRELAGTGRFAREGPALDAEGGPRRTGDGAVVLEAFAHIEVPLLSGGKARTIADSSLKAAGPDVLAARAVESRLRLRTAFLDAWLEQARIAVIDAEVEATRQILAAVHKRVQEGADAPYEAALVEGDLLRSLSQRDSAEAALGEAWSRLRALAELPPSPCRLEAPGLPEVAMPADAQARFEGGQLRRALVHRGAMDKAFVDLDQSRRRSRWSIAGTLAKEGYESYATIGAGYRFARRGEQAATARERDAATMAIGREVEVDGAKLATRFATATARAERFGPVSDPNAFTDALAAIALRMELGKERPSQALPVRHQVLESQAAALERVRDAHVLIAEIEALTSGDAP